MSSSYEAIYEQVRLIPSGSVATYGQIAALAGRPKHARQVGYALHALDEESDVPWHRVINARGEISLRSVDGKMIQRVLLEAEGVTFVEGRVRLKDWRWNPRDRSDKS